jgi:hypothetical protein
MLTINIKELNKIEEKYYYQGILFTGVGFRISGEKIEDNLRFEGGICVGYYTSKYFPNEKDVPHIDIDYIEFTGEYLDNYALYKNEYFSGVAYELENEQKICLGQHFMKNGEKVASVGWYLSGQMECLTLIEEDLVQGFGWYEDGSLGGLDIYLKEKKERLIVSLGEHKQLKTVWIKENYFQWLPNYKDRLEFHYFESKNSFKEFSASSTFTLIDPGVDDVVFYAIASNNGLENLSDILISQTSMSEEAILELVNVITLKELSLRDDNCDLLGVAQKFKHQRLDCLVNLNDREITVHY